MPLIEQNFLDLCQGFDIGAFWEENKHCDKRGTDKPRCAAKGGGQDDHWMFEFLGGVSTLR